MGVIREHTSHWWLLCSLGVLSSSSPHTINVVPYYRCVGGGPELANLISGMWGDVAEEATWVWAWLWSGIPRDDYASVIRDRSGPRRKDQWLPTSSKIKAYLKPMALKKNNLNLACGRAPSPCPVCSVNVCVLMLLGIPVQRLTFRTHKGYVAIGGRFPHLVWSLTPMRYMFPGCGRRSKVRPWQLMRLTRTTDVWFRAL